MQRQSSCTSYDENSRDEQAEVSFHTQSQKIYHYRNDENFCLLSKHYVVNISRLLRFSTSSMTTDSDAYLPSQNCTN